MRRIIHPDPLYRLSHPDGEVEQKHINAWCDHCQFPYQEPWCLIPNIQRCWNESYGIAVTLAEGKQGHIWHLQHECPFVHKGEACRCNDFREIEEAFQAAGVLLRRMK